MNKTKSFTKRKTTKPSTKRAVYEETPQEKLVTVRKKLANLRAAQVRLQKELAGSQALRDIETRIGIAEKYIVKLEIQAAEQVTS
jgi:hypothetical protein